MVRNALSADHIVRFEPALSPVNLEPSASSIDLDVAWGRSRVDKAIPVTSTLLEPIWWEGERPVLDEAEPPARSKSVAWPMSAVMSAIQLPSSRFERWRSRRLT